MDALLIVGLIFTFVGFIFLFVAFILYNHRKGLEERCNQKAYGDVIRILEKSDGMIGNGHYNQRYYSPEVRFITYEGREVITHSKVYTFPCRFSVGQNVTICYDGSDPEKFYIAEDKNTSILFKIFFLVSTLLLIIGVSMILVSFFI